MYAYTKTHRNIIFKLNNRDISYSRYNIQLLSNYLSLAHIPSAFKLGLVMSFGVPQYIQVTFSPAEIENMLNLSKAAPFPDKSPIDCSTPWKLGVDHQYLKNLKTKFETEWSWETLEKKIAKYDNYLIHYENGADVLDLHYVHVRSSRSNAVPLILLHGWPSGYSLLYYGIFFI